MRIAPFTVAPWTAAVSAQLSQTVSQAASHRSSPTERPVDPARTIQGDAPLRRVSTHTFDIRV